MKDVKLVVIQVQYLAARLSCFHCLKLRLNWSLVMVSLLSDYLEGHLENHVKLELKIVFLVWPKEFSIIISEGRRNDERKQNKKRRKN